MDNYIEQLKEMLAFYSDCQNKYTEELQTLPDGTLRYVNDKQRTQYIWAKPESGHIRRIGINSRPDLIRQLARKEFLKRSLKEICANINTIQTAINNYREINPSAIISSMTRAYSSLSQDQFFLPSEPVFSTPDQTLKERLKSHQAWAEMDYEKNDYPFGEFSQYTSKGLHVRSSRELIIAELLYKYEIPFRYDQIIRAGRDKLSPDFTFEMADMRELYFEYCGMMDTEKYVFHFLDKRRKYEQAGIFEWDNIIYAFSSGPKVNTAEIDAIIRTRILPRL